MKCFIHLETEAVAACRQCGKGMCANCSAYSGHTGICPECRLKEFKVEVAKKSAKMDELHREFIWRVVKSVLLCWLIIPIFKGLFVGYQIKKEMKALESRIAQLRPEIEKLEGVLRRRGGAAFV